MKAKLFNFTLFHHLEVKDWKRSILIDWCMEVCSEFLLQRRTFHLSVNIIDMYLSQTLSIKEGDLQLLAVTSLYMASKYEEI